VHPAPRARLLTAAIPAAVSGVVTWWLLTTSHWSYWGIATMVPANPEVTSFGDLKTILATSLCMQQGTDYTTCDPYGRPFTPYALLPARAAAALGLDLTNVTTIGVGLAVLYVLVIAGLGLVLARGWRAHTMPLLAAQALLGLAAITAPPMLAIERGQVEILTLALAVVALLALSRERLAPGILGAVSAVAAVVSKFFAIGLFAPFVRRGRPNWPALAGLGLGIVFLLLFWGDLQQAISTSRAEEPATSKTQFGAMAMIATMLSDEPLTGSPGPWVVDHWAAIRIAGVLVTVLAVAIAAVAIPRGSVRTLDAHPSARALLIGGTGVLVLPYVTGASHDYRQVFCLPVLVGALLWWAAAEGRSRWAPGLVTASVMLSLVTGAAMIANPDDSIWSLSYTWAKPALVAGDLGLLLTLAVGGGLWIRGWSRHDA
jgi:hypothetical protein